MNYTTRPGNAISIEFISDRPLLINLFRYCCCCHLNLAARIECMQNAVNAIRFATWQMPLETHKIHCVALLGWNWNYRRILQY